MIELLLECNWHLDKVNKIIINKFDTYSEIMHNRNVPLNIPNAIDFKIWSRADIYHIDIKQSLKKYEKNLKALLMSFI